MYLVRVTSAFLPGLVTGLALIVAIGAQNAFVLRQGIRREHVGVVVAICIVSDIFLIGLGTAGIGVLIEQVPWLINAFRWAGVVYLVVFAVMSFRSALKPQTMEAAGSGAGSLRGVVLATLAFTCARSSLAVGTALSPRNIARLTGSPITSQLSSAAADRGCWTSRIPIAFAPRSVLVSASIAR